MIKTTNKFSPEVRARAVRMLMDRESEYQLRWKSVVSAAKVRLVAKIARERPIVERLPELSVQTHELADAPGRIINGQVDAVTGANRNAVKKHFQKPVSASHLVQHDSGKVAMA